MKAILTLSLGGTYPAPPNTGGGTIEKPMAAVADCAKNLRRETEPSKKLQDRGRFFTVPPKRSSQILDDFRCCQHFAPICQRIDQPGYCKRTRGLYVRKLAIPLFAGCREWMTADSENKMDPPQPPDGRPFLQNLRIRRMQELLVVPRLRFTGASGPRLAVRLNCFTFIDIIFERRMCLPF
jgi:hypothetical protein